MYLLRAALVAVAMLVTTSWSLRAEAQCMPAETLVTQVMEIEAKGAKVYRVADVKDFLVAYNEVSGAAPVELDAVAIVQVPVAVTGYPEDLYFIIGIKGIVGCAVSASQGELRKLAIHYSSRGV